MAIYRLGKAVATKLIDRSPGNNSAARLLRLDLADLTAIRDIKIEREPALQLDINGSPTTEVLRTFSGKPVFTDRSKEMITLDVTFFVRQGEISMLSQDYGGNVDNMSVSLVKIIGDEFSQPLATSMINIGNLSRQKTQLAKSAAQNDDGIGARIDISNIQNEVHPDQTGESDLFPVRTSLKFSLEDALKAVGPNKDMQDLNLDLSLVFGLFMSQKGVMDVGVPVRDSNYFVKYDIDKDLRVYYTVKSPVKIKAFASSIERSLITIEKPSFCNAEKVRVFRRILSPGSAPGPFMSVKDIDFPRDTNTKISESYTETFIDGTPNFQNPNDITNPLNNTLRYQYRAVPVGKDNAGTIVFQDAYTDPITQANFEIGTGLRMLPEIQSKNGVLKQTGQSLHDKNFLDPGQPLVNPASDITIVSYYNSDGAITIEISNLESSVAIDILRRDISKNEVRFTPVNDFDNLNKSKHITAEMESDARILYTDTSVIEGHLYEYAVRSYTATGLSQISDDKTLIQFRDQALLGIGVEVMASDPVVVGTTATIDIGILIPNSVTQLVNVLLGSRDPDSRQTPFFEDIIKNREDLPPLFLPVVRRLNLTTGAERKFSSLTLDARRFENLTPSNEGLELPSVFEFRFTDDSLSIGSLYRYEILVNARMPLSLLPSKVFVKDNIRRPYIFQPAKMQNPVFLQRGILPPSREGQDFLSSGDISVGPDRLLNRLTQEDPFELGSTGARTVVPAAAPISLPLPADSDFNMTTPTVKKTRQSAIELQWAIRGKKSVIDHFCVIAHDEYAARVSLGPGEEPGGAKCRRSKIVALVPAQGTSSYSIETKLERLLETDYNDFIPLAGGPVPPMSVLQSLTDRKRITVTRKLEVRAIFYQGAVKRSVTKTSRSIGIISPISSRLSAASKINIPPRFALSPNIAFATNEQFDKAAIEDVLASMQEAEKANNAGKGGGIGVANTGIKTGDIEYTGQGVAQAGNTQTAYAVYVEDADKTAQKDKKAKKQKGEGYEIGKGWPD